MNNKNDAILKINKYGKVGKIITIIMIVFIGLSTIATISASIGLYIIPDDLINIKIDSQAEMELNPGVIEGSVPDSELQAIADAVNKGNVNAGINMGVARYTFQNAEINNGKVTLRTDESVGNISMKSIAKALVVAVFALALTLVSLIFGCLLCTAFEKCTSPFDDNVIKKMRLFAFSLIPWALFESVPETVLGSVFGNNLHVSVALDYNVIFAVLIILALSVVFKYGAMLQTESDETL